MRNDIEIHPLGLGKAWRSNISKIDPLYDFVMTLPSDEVVLATDGFDVIYVQPADVIMSRFLGIYPLASRP